MLFSKGYVMYHATIYCHFVCHVTTVLRHLLCNNSATTFPSVSKYDTVQLQNLDASLLRTSINNILNNSGNNNYNHSININKISKNHNYKVYNIKNIVVI